MSKQRVPLAGAADGRRVVTIDTDATVGAVVGVNLVLEDGTVLAAEQIINPAPVADEDPGVVYWRLLYEVPDNIVAVELLTGDGFVRRAPDGSWSASPIVNTDLAGADTGGLAEGANLYFTDERSQDAVGAAISAGAGDGVALSYDDVGNKINATNTDKGSVAVASHVAEANPHTQYPQIVGTIADANILEYDGISSTWTPTLSPRELYIDGGNF